MNLVITKAISMESVNDMLNHLYAVTLGQSFYLNSIRISKSTIQKCCESYWHYDRPNPTDNNELDLARALSINQLINLIDDFEKQPEDLYILFNLREKLRSISPFINSGRPTQSRPIRQNAVDCEYLLLDLRIITLTMFATLIRLCRILRLNYKNDALREPIVNDMQEHFVRPYSLILWGRARRDLLA